MILGPGQELRLVLAAANDTADSTWVASWFRNAPASSPVNAPQPMEKGTTNGTTPVTVIAAPSSGQTAHLTEFSLVNTDTAPITVELQLYESSTPYTFSTWTLAEGDVLKCDKNNRWYLTDENGREKVAGIKGDTGPSGGFVTLELPFAYGDATPSPIGTALADKLILSVALYITSYFDGTGPALTIGDAGVNDRLMAAGQNDPTSEGEYETHPVYAYGSDTPLNLYITPGSGATQGAGLVVITFQT